MPPGFIWRFRPPSLAPTTQSSPHTEKQLLCKGAPCRSLLSKSPRSMRLQGSDVGCRLQCLPAWLSGSGQVSLDVSDDDA